MSSSFTRLFRRSAAVGVAAIALVPALAMAQQSPAPDDQASQTNNEEIVVTGTLLRNVAPAGAQAIAFNAAQIEATGATSTDQLLATIPQLNSFGNLQTVNSGGTQLTVNRINLRNLPQGIGGSSPTLVLLDGHRMVSAGVKQAFPDPDVIPPALIQRVDVLTDGGSASYGSDAVGGVVNFITKRNYDGVEIGIRQGFGSSYKSTDINFTAGKTWSTGSVYVGYNFSRHDAIFGRDRDYVRHYNYTTNLPSDLQCGRANVVQGGQVYAVNGGNSLALSNANLCDRSDNSSFYPEETRHSVMAGFRQELSDTLEFEVKGYYSRRKNSSFGGPRGTTVAVASTAPSYISTGGGSTATQQVSFDFGPAGDSAAVKTDLWSWGITPSLTWKIGGDWQMHAFYNYGRSKTTADNPVVNATALSAAVNAGTINPYNVAVSSPAAIANVLNYSDYGVGKDTLSNGKVTFDGPLFDLPGGELRVAAGGEFIHESFSGFYKTDTYQNIANAAYFPASRNVWSAFGELNVPLIGPDNDIPLVRKFTIAAAVRYDHYSDFGGNWAPNVGATWELGEGFSLRARWNKSFQAPSLVQLSQAQSPFVGVYPGSIIGFVPLLQNPAYPVNANTGPIIALQGTVLPLQPQRARSYNLGFDFSPTPIPGLNIHFTYFNTVYSGQISSPPLGSGPFYSVAGFQDLFIMTPNNANNQEVIRNFLSGRGASTADINNAIAQITNPGTTAYVVADIRARNLGVTKVKGFDMAFDYRHETSFGSLDFSFSGSLTTSILPAADGVTFLPNQAGIDGTRFNSVTRVGANVGEDFRAIATWNHLDGLTLSAPAGLGQTHVNAFNTIDLYMQYNLKQNGLPPISLSLGITNLFNVDPPLYRGVAAGTAGGYFNGSTVGRLFQLGASVKF